MQRSDSRIVSVDLAPAVPREYRELYQYLTLRGTYSSSDERQRFVARNFAPHLIDSVLDVGCANKILQKHLSSATRYVGIDVHEPADIILDLDQRDLPFRDGEFECVVCCDVLEHLERIHTVFDELCRVCYGSVIVSLPNCYPICRRTRSRAFPDIKYYGLPVERPSDRHRWVFGCGEAVRFILARAKLNGAHMVHACATYQPHPIKRWIRRILAVKYGCYVNHVLSAVWARVDLAQTGEQ
jgi:hypothetical protein